MAYKRVKKDKKPFIFTVVGLSLLILISSQTEALSKTGSNLASCFKAYREGDLFYIICYYWADWKNNRLKRNSRTSFKTRGR